MIMCFIYNLIISITFQQKKNKIEYSEKLNKYFIMCRCPNQNDSCLSMKFVHLMQNNFNFKSYAYKE